MEEKFQELNNEDALRAENDFLKMKLMLERGAQFKRVSDECTPEMENEFLNYIMEFERQAENPIYIKLYDKIEKPTQFKPVKEVSDEEMDGELEKLLEYLDDYSIDVSVCSPNIPAREVYRFILEELFDQEMADMNIPGMMHGFIYDEFHPDPIFENSRVAVDDCISQILSKKQLEFMVFFRNDELQLNDNFPLSHADFKKRIRLFKESFEEIKNLKIDDVKCSVEGRFSYVKGSYEFIGQVGVDDVCYKGRWLINFEKDEEFQYWNIFSVNIEGINF